MVKRDAIFSADNEHRYRLFRSLDGDFRDKTLTFVLLNPSTADDEIDDDATKRCIEIAKYHDFKHLEIVNLFSLIEPTSEDLEDAKNPVRQENDKHIIESCEEADKIICGWGNIGDHMNRAAEVYEKISHHDLECLRVNQTGEPTYVNPNGPLQHQLSYDTRPYERAIEVY
ncbi:DUF1643 domain-containing protein [Natrononativus amylolyticus]|uniref:DUF1643 domain-containing protein n=1 Tax=Natrononativus amylolyticus TaxID=2963434 RepID=UPI0020CB8D82|nr:DUF1643 domain-containing protein [Natrononativus amylolyticus]